MTLPHPEADVAAGCMVHHMSFRARPIWFEHTGPHEVEDGIAHFAAKSGLTSVARLPLTESPYILCERRLCGMQPAYGPMTRHDLRDFWATKGVVFPR